MPLRSDNRLGTARYSTFFGIEYGPIVVTAVDRDATPRPLPRLPRDAAREAIPAWYEMPCSQAGCGARLRLQLIRVA